VSHRLISELASGNAFVELVSRPKDPRRLQAGLPILR
jgi:hypothetical protein